MSDHGTGPVGPESLYSAVQVSLDDLEHEQRRLFWERVYVAAVQASGDGLLPGVMSDAFLAERAAAVVATFAEQVAAKALKERDARSKAERPAVKQPTPPEPVDEPRYLGER